MRPPDSAFLRPHLVDEGFDVLGPDPGRLGPIPAELPKGGETLTPYPLPQRAPDELGLGHARRPGQGLEFLGEIIREGNGE